MKFHYYMPTRLVASRECLKDHQALLGALGKKAFIMTGGTSAYKNGSLQDLIAALEAQGVAWHHFAGVKPNPSLQEVRQAAGEAKNWGADFIVAIGGGSPMDAAKAVAVLAAGEVTDQELLSQRKFARVLPLAVVPTTSGTGSEVTPYSILTNDEIQSKSFLNSEQVYPAVAFLDGRYTLDLPPAITCATVVDALSHAVEGFLAVRSIPPTRCLAREAMTLMGPLLATLAKREVLTLENRETLLYASTLAGMVIAQSGTTAVHAMGYSLTYFKGLDHGVANGRLLAQYLRFVAKERPGEVKEVLRALGIPNLEDLEEYLGRLVGRLEITPEEIRQFSGIAVKAGNIQNTHPRPSEEDLAEIYRTSSLL